MELESKTCFGLHIFSLASFQREANMKLFLNMSFLVVSALLGTAGAVHGGPTDEKREPQSQRFDPNYLFVVEVDASGDQPEPGSSVDVEYRNAANVKGVWNTWYASKDPIVCRSTFRASEIVSVRISTGGAVTSKARKVGDRWVYSLCYGDANRDNQIGIQDLEILEPFMGSSITDSRWWPRTGGYTGLNVDFHSDLEITVADYIIVLNNLGRKGA